MRPTVFAIIVLSVSLMCVTAAMASEKKSPEANDVRYNPEILGEKFDRDTIKIFKDQAKAYEKALDEAARKAAFDQVLALGPRAAAGILQLIDYQLATAEEKYTKNLEPKLRQAYIAKLLALSDEQILSIQKTRRMWKSYAQETGNKARPNFQKEFLAPMWQVADLILIKMQDIQDEELQAQRKTVLEFAGYRQTCYDMLKVESDPTKNKKSPTGIAYAHLNQPPTYADNLHHLERTMVLISTVAPKGAREALMMNDRDVREIDVQEAEFVMFGNEIRMLSGTIAWRADPLGCAVTRDHSNDRKDGKASGHMSDVEGKRGFGDRNKRMGASFFNSEGAGGGRDGRGYINGLSYSGEGHGGPLYSQKRNCVGVGRRDGVYTSQYRFDKSIVHDCQAAQNELFMPPGFTRTDIKNSSLLKIYAAIQADAWGAAATLLPKVKTKTDDDTVLVKFFTAAIDAEIDWLQQSAAAIKQVGDVYEYKRRVDAAQKRFYGVENINETLQPLINAVSGEAGEEHATALEAGQLYHQIAEAKYEKDVLTMALNQFIKRYGETIYGEAAKAALADEGLNMYTYFLNKYDLLCKFEYPKIIKSKEK